MAKVHYGKTFNTGNYESLRLDYEDDVQADETTEAAYVRCKAEVFEQANREHRLRVKHDTLEEVDQHINYALQRLTTLVSLHHLAVEKYDKLRATAHNLGLELQALTVYQKPYTPEEMEEIRQKALLKLPKPVESDLSMYGDQADDEEDEDEEDEDDND